MMTNKVHVFEKAGLGKAPYKFLGVEEKRGPITLPNGTMVGAPGQPMGSCQYCSTGIAYLYWLLSADGKKFYVGSDCIYKSGDAGLKREIEPKVRELKKKVRDANTARKRELRKAQWHESIQAEIAQRRPGFEVVTRELFARAAAFMSDATVNDIVTKTTAMARISEPQMKFLDSIVTRLELNAKASATSNHVGTIGQRIETPVKVVRLGSYQRAAFGSWGRMETVWIVSMEDAQGNIIVTKTPSFKQEVGESFILRGTVKKHDEYQNVKQTVVNYPVRKEAK